MKDVREDGLIRGPSLQTRPGRTAQESRPTTHEAASVHLARLLRALFVFLLVVPVRFYQMVIGPLLPKMCKFQPSCSEYFIEAVHKHGPVRGAYKGVWRICRCNPWNRGGYDPP